MDIYPFPNCCTGAVAVNFGQTRTNGMDCIGSLPDYADIKDELSDMLDDYKYDGFAFVSATTNNEQKIDNKVLKDLGFEYSAWMSKKAHPETKVRLWWKQLDKWDS